MPAGTGAGGRSGGPSRGAARRTSSFTTLTIGTRQRGRDTVAIFAVFDHGLDEQVLSVTERPSYPVVLPPPPVLIVQLPEPVDIYAMDNAGYGDDLPVHQQELPQIVST